jgi:hypothetical protein
LTSPTAAERVDAQGNQIREAAKWLVGSFAAVGAALIAGSQLSSIGRLPVCAPTSIVCGRLWIAVIGAVAALVGVVWAVWTGVGLLAPVRLQVPDLKNEWRSGRPIFDYFKANPSQLQGFSSPTDLEEQETDAYKRFDDLNTRIAEASEAEAGQLDEELSQAEEALNDILARGDDVVTIANHVNYVHFFRSDALGRLIRAAAISAIGIVAFAWAANPVSVAAKTASMRGADLSGSGLQGVNLRDVDLSGANLAGANLTGADLTGADLTDAKLDGVVWSSTTCPDGVSSDDSGNSCLNHLLD